MNCEGVIHELSNFIDGELDAAMRLELERHLSDCEDCRLVIVQTKKTIEIFCGCEEVEFPADVRTQLHEAIRRKLGGAPS